MAVMGVSFCIRRVSATYPVPKIYPYSALLQNIEYGLEFDV
jgi:hypothetical protein